MKIQHPDFCRWVATWGRSAALMENEAWISTLSAEDFRWHRAQQFDAGYEAFIRFDGPSPFASDAWQDGYRAAQWDEESEA